MRIQFLPACLAALSFFSFSAQANNGNGFGPCKTGFSDGTVVKTEARGELKIAQVVVDDRVWSLHQDVGRPGWAKIVRKLEAGTHYKLLADFTEPGATAITKTCWLIKKD